MTKGKKALLRLAKKGFDFKQAMTELTKENKELKKLNNTYEEYKKLDDYFQNNKDFRNKVLEIKSQFEIKSHIVEEWERMLHKVEDRKLQKEMKEIKERHPKEKWSVDGGSGTFMQKILKHTLENHFNSLEDAYEDYKKRGLK